MLLLGRELLGKFGKLPGKSPGKFGENFRKSQSLLSTATIVTRRKPWTLKPGPQFPLPFPQKRFVVGTVSAGMGMGGGVSEKTKES